MGLTAKEKAREYWGKDLEKSMSNQPRQTRDRK
jgi:hypothetical protein